MPTGSVIQVVSATLSGSFYTTSASYAASGLIATITPQFSNSKILVQSVLSWTHKGGGQAASPVMLYSMYRQINSGGYSSNRFITGQGNINSAAGNGGDAYIGGISYLYLDSPATTSVVNYQVYVQSDGTIPVYMGENNATCTITAMEIRQ
jgi:hypothetical protein